MTKGSKYISTVFQPIIFLMASVSYSIGQNISPIELVEKNLENYFTQNLHEKIYVHTDRTSYLTGETMWFKIYYVDATNKPLSLSKVAYVEILDGENKSLLQTKVSIDQDGTGSGSLFIPASFQSDNYVLRAYTSWMKNYFPDFYYHQSLTIVNPFARLTLPDFNEVQKLDMQFFPEGGDLINGLLSKVAFKATDQTGRGVELDGIVINEQQDTVAKMNSSKFGIGSFQLRPGSNHSYKAMVWIGNKHQTFDIPKARNEGYVMRIAEPNSQNIKIEVAGSNNNRNADGINQIYLIVHAGQKIVKLMKASMNNSNETVFSVDQNDIVDGVSRLTIFDHEANPISERSYFKWPEKFSATRLAADRSEYSSRSKISIEGTTEKFASSASLSVSVHKVDSLGFASANLYDYLWFTSELKGRVENPQYYFEGGRTAEKLSLIDDLMLVHGWSRFKWDSITREPMQPKFFPEIGGPIIRGQLTYSDSGLPAKHKTVWVSSPSKAARPSETQSDSLGRFKLEMGTATGNRTYVSKVDRIRDSVRHKEQMGVLFENKDLQGIKKYLEKIDETNASKPTSISLFSSFSDDYSDFKAERFDLNEKIAETIQQRSLHMQVGNIFQKENRNTTTVARQSSFYGEAPYQYILDDYTRFPTMEEVLREYVPRVVVRKRDQEFNFRVVDDLQSTVFTKLPLVLLDGVPVFDINKLMEFDPLKIYKLDVVSRKYFLGGSSFEGVLSFITYDGNFEGFDDTQEKVIQNFQGLQERREFYSPKYELSESQESRRPDVRSLLYWNPDLTLDENGKFSVEFYSSDIAGQYVAEVQGMDAEGNCTDSKVYFSVTDRAIN